MERIYLDHAATSPTHPDVVKEMSPYMSEIFGNPSSIHSFGRESRQAIDDARQTISASIGAKSTEIIFTSGGTEADNLALIGVALANKHRGNHIITTKVEHHAILHTCEYLETQGFKVTYLPVQENGSVSIEDVKASLTDQTILVSMMLANNEVGTIQPIKELSEIVRANGAYVHSDIVQGYNLYPINVDDLGIDLLSVSGHKINGPKGVGYLYVRSGVKITPSVHGGEQERKRRAGTENVASIVGLKHAVQLSDKGRNERFELYSSYKKQMIDIFKREEIDFSINGDLELTVPNILNVSFAGVSVEALLVNLDLIGIAASSGSACTAGSVDPSHVLVAMFGKDSERIQSSIRFSFGYGNNEEEIRKAAYEITKVVKRLTKY
ncbi:cysteine desulfurase family protein [Cytobacillus sp. IB215665]|uniref:cysteine desulfurase family protein n=1 Tax=Cytobacillus sp. IB215665 TaxID=3097357 RepID=UPI002A111DCF|nr:cysteine desulfurase family protein [Cytobacillus sp. IB215665]MDX8364101.1 cysteine desulfurase family protein [Cytobacillus sp. IB215665]